MSRKENGSAGKRRAGPRGTVVIDTERCKGCELCVPACPPNVLRMSSRRNSSGYLLPELVEGCTGCGACLLVCPDFCFEVYRFTDAADAATPVLTEAEALAEAQEEAHR